MWYIYAEPSYADGVSRARSAARAHRRDPSIASASGFAPPSTRRAVRAKSSFVTTASIAGQMRTLLAKIEADSPKSTAAVNKWWEILCDSRVSPH